MDHKEFMASLPDDVQELKEIIEIQKFELSALRKTNRLYEHPYILSVNFKKLKKKKG